MSLFSILFPAEYKQLNDIKMKLDEALTTLKAVKAQQEKTGTEIKGVQAAVDTLKEKIKALEEAAADADLPQELTDAITAVKEQGQIVDDEIPDEVTPVPDPGA